MRTRLVLVCLLLGASLVIGVQENDVKNVKEKNKAEDKIGEEVKSDMKEVSKKNNSKDDDTLKRTLEEKDQQPSNIEILDNITSINCNVSTKNSVSSIFSNTTNLNSSLLENTNITEDFNELNYTSDNFGQETDIIYSDEYFNDSITTEYYDPKKFERRSDDFEDETFIDDKVKPVRESSPKIDMKMVEMAFKSDQSSKIKNILQHHDPKKIYRRTFDIMSMLGFRNNMKKDMVVKITKEVAVPVPYTVEKNIPVPVKVEVEHPVPVHVPKAYPVTVEKKVYYPVKEYVHAPYPVYKKIPYLIKIAVEKPVPVHIEKPYPVYIERKVPYPVEKQIHYPVKVPVDRPIPIQIPVVKNIYYPVQKKVVYPVPVPIEKPVAVPIEKPYPVYVEKEVPVPVVTHVPIQIPVEEHNFSEETTNNKNEHTEDLSLLPLNQIETPNNDYGKIEGGFVPIDENHNPIQLQDKKDEGVTIEEPKQTGNSTEKSTLKNENKKNEEKNKKKEKDVQEFGRKIQIS